MLIQEELIKWIVGAFVVVLVVSGVYLFFKYNILDFFRNLGGNEPTKIVLSLIR